MKNLLKAGLFGLVISSTLLACDPPKTNSKPPVDSSSKPVDSAKVTIDSAKKDSVKK